VNSEAAKNLVLCGVNFDIYDDLVVSDIDIETNFLLG